MKIEPKVLKFENNSLLTDLLGNNDVNLKKIQEFLGITITSRGNLIFLTGAPKSVEIAVSVLNLNYVKIEQGNEVTVSDIEASLRMASDSGNKFERVNKTLELLSSEIVIKTEKKNISPQSTVQAEYIKTLFKKDMIFSNGPAGTGKTYMAVAVAVSLLISHKVDKIILTRPAVEAGEKIGFLPGDMKEKVDPFMQPIYDSLYDMLSPEKVKKYIENRVIEIAPLAYMRGRTLKDAFVILDEAQNTTPTQMKMFLTRLGENSKMVINGDLSQIDLPSNSKSGLEEAMNKLRKIKEIGFIKFSEEDIVRHHLVGKIVRAYKES